MRNFTLPRPKCKGTNRESRVKFITRFGIKTLAFFQPFMSAFWSLRNYRCSSHWCWLVFLTRGGSIPIALLFLSVLPARKAQPQR